MKIALCTSAHGFGHTARQIALIHVLSENHQVTLFTHAPKLVENTTAVAVRRVVWDVGLIQHDSFGVDVDATRSWLDSHVHPYFIEAISDELQGFDLCICDINPMVMVAAQNIDLRCVAIGNFSWSWIYSHFSDLHQWAKQFRAWEAGCDAIDISGPLGPGLSHFKSIETAGLLARNIAAYPLPKRSVLLSFGGFGLKNPVRLMPSIDGVHYVAGAETAVHPKLYSYPNAPYSGLIAGASVIVSKVGYGIVTEAMQSGVPLLCLSRSGFPESVFLERWLRERGDRILEIEPSNPQFENAFRCALEQALERGKHSPVPQTGAHDICRILGL